MPQTLLALVAVVAVSILVLGSSRGRVQDAAWSYQSDAVVQARGVGVSVLERLASYPFDGGEGGAPTADGTDAYSPSASFGTPIPTAGRALDDLFGHPTLDDLDDFEGVAGAVAAQAVSDPEGGAGGAVAFEVSIDVAYADRTGTGGWGPVASGRTHYKQVTVEVNHPQFTTPLRFGRVYAAP